jgi:hypothetical protein
MEEKSDDVGEPTVLWNAAVRGCMRPLQHLHICIAAGGLASPTIVWCGRCCSGALLLLQLQLLH